MQKESLKLFSEILTSILAYNKLSKSDLLELRAQIGKLQDIPDEDRVDLMINCNLIFDSENYKDNMHTLAERKAARVYERCLNKGRFCKRGDINGN